MTIDKQAVQAVADLKAGYTLGNADVEIIQQMALDAVTLLDELDKYQKYAKERDAENESLALTVGRLRIELEAAEKRGADMEIACELYAESKLQQIKLEAANAAQDDHINQQDDRIESLEKKNGELGRALGAAEQHIAELEARTPYGYLRECDGQIQISIGNNRPHDRSGGYATPWFAIYTAAGISIKGSE